MFGDVNDQRLLPAEKEVAKPCPQDDCQTEPDVVRHEDEHQEVGQDHLHHVQYRLPRVHPTQHLHLDSFLSLLERATIVDRDGDSVVLDCTE